MNDHDELARFSVSIPHHLLDELDRRVIGQGYSSRSEYVRDLIREKMIEDRWEGADEEVVGVLTIGYDHHQRDLPQKLMDVQHSRFVNVLCTTHVHLDHHHCLETIMIRGNPNEIEKLAIRIGGMRGVSFAKLTRTSDLS